MLFRHAHQQFISSEPNHNCISTKVNLITRSSYYIFKNFFIWSFWNGFSLEISTNTKLWYHPTQLLYLNDSILSFSTGTLLHPSEYPGVMLYMGTLLFFMFMNSALTALGAGLSYIPMLWTVYLSIAIIFLSKQRPKTGKALCWMLLFIVPSLTFSALFHPLMSILSIIF